MPLLKKILKWVGITLIGIGCAFAVLVVFRAFHFYNLDKTNEQVAKIHATKITFADVMGENLPPDPGEKADKTIEGVDANENGIRDDVELAVFKEYPNSAKTRAVLLQYALALQMEFTQPILNKDTVTETIRELSRADVCIADTLVPRQSPESFREYVDIEKINTYIDFVEKLQINTEGRIKYDEEFYNKLGSFSESESEICDLDLSTLSN